MRGHRPRKRSGVRFEGVGSSLFSGNHLHGITVFRRGGSVGDFFVTVTSVWNLVKDVDSMRAMTGWDQGTDSFLVYFRSFSNKVPEYSQISRKCHEGKLSGLPQVMHGFTANK